MNTTQKIIVVIFALIVNLVIYWCFRETISFENETANYVTTTASYQGENYKVCNEFNQNDCVYKYIYHYLTPDKGTYRITYRSFTEQFPPVGARKLVKYDASNPNLAFFTKVNVLYLFYLIEFALLFVVIWVCFSRQPRKVDVVVDGNVVEMNREEPRFYYGQAIIAAIFTFVCIAFYISLGNTIKTFNPITLMKVTHPAGLVLIALLILGIFMTFWAYKGRNYRH